MSALFSIRVCKPAAVAVLLSTVLAACTMPKRAPEPDEWQETTGQRAEVMVAPTSPPRLEIAGGTRPSPVTIAVQARPLVRPPPSYPAALIEESLEGRVLASFIVDESGRVGSVEIVRASHPEFAEAVRTALARWRFEPARSPAGEPVPSEVKVPFQFRLE